jgi:hypothetical protein
VIFNGGGDGIRWHSASKDSFDRDGVGGGFSSKRRIDAGVLGEADQRQWLAQRRWLSVGSNLHGGRSYL